jgi:hypothetical protein
MVGIFQNFELFLWRKDCGLSPQAMDHIRRGQRGELTGAQPVATLELKDADQRRRWGRGIRFGLHRRVSGGEAAGRPGSVVVVGGAQRDEV